VIALTPNFEQVKGIIERVAYLIVMWLVAKGVIPQTMAGDLVLILVSLAAIFWGWKTNTQPSLVAATAALPDVKKVVVEDPALTTVSTPTAPVTTS
jgi:hypothetical protein